MGIINIPLGEAGAIDPERPLCELPYKKPPTIEPLDAAARGLIAPVHDLFSSYHYWNHATLLELFPPGKDFKPSGKMGDLIWKLNAYLAEGFFVDGIFSQRQRTKPCFT